MKLSEGQEGSKNPYAFPPFATHHFHKIVQDLLGNRFRCSACKRNRKSCQIDPNNMETWIMKSCLKPPCNMGPTITSRLFIEVILRIPIYAKIQPSQPEESEARDSREREREEEKGERRSQKEKIREEKHQTKEDPNELHVRETAKHCVLPRFCGSGGSKGRLAKATGAWACGEDVDQNRKVVNTFWSSTSEILHHAVVRERSWSQKLLQYFSSSTL